VEEILYQWLTIGNYEKEKPLVTMGSDGIIMGFFHGINMDKPSKHSKAMVSSINV